MNRVIFAACCVALLAGCNKPIDYVSFHFSFPQSIPPHERGWTYHGTAYVTYEGPTFDTVGNKEITVSVETSDKNLVLQQKFKMCSGYFDFRVVWEKKESFQLIFYEEKANGVQRELKNVKFDLDSVTGKFHSVPVAIAEERCS